MVRRFGQILFLASLSIFLIGLLWGGAQYSWGSYETLIPLCVGVAGIVATGFWEFYGATNPFLRLSLHYLPLYLQSVTLFSAIMNGVGVLPISIALMPTSIIVAFVISKTGQYRWALWAGWVTTISATGVTTILKQQTSTVAWIFIFAYVGLGQGILYNALPTGAQASSPAKDVAYSAALYTFFRTLGFAIGVIIGGTVLQNFMATKLGDLGLPTEIAQNAESYVSTLKGLPVGYTLREGVIEADVYCLDGVFEVMTGIGPIGFLVTPIVAKRTLDKSLETEHTIQGAQSGDSTPVAKEEA
ncbi:efflux pump antibiotic resistance protein [Penicillium malachiteum]|nr:efflux pump antibiotic resistance protein [Penicillium malachiteum]